MVHDCLMVYQKSNQNGLFFTFLRDSPLGSHRSNLFEHPCLFLRLVHGDPLQFFPRRLAETWVPASDFDAKSFKMFSNILQMPQEFHFTSD